MSGTVGDLSPAQQTALVAVKAKLLENNDIARIPQPYASDPDATLLRFLRARDFDLNNALTMIGNWLKWYEDEQIADLYEKLDREGIKQISDKYYPQYWHSITKTGQPIYIQELGSLDTNNLFQHVSAHDIIYYTILHGEENARVRFPACAKLMNVPRMERSASIMDLKGMSYAEFWRIREALGQISKMSQEYHPETNGGVFIINAPFIFGAVWKIAKTFLDKNTQEKIHILGGDFSTTLLQYIEADNLPVKYGGKCECAEGCMSSNKGPWRE